MKNYKNVIVFDTANCEEIIFQFQTPLAALKRAYKNKYGITPPQPKNDNGILRLAEFSTRIRQFKHAAEILAECAEDCEVL